MATRTMPFCLEMLAFGPPRELPAHSWNSGLPAHSWNSGRGEGLMPLAQCLFAWKCSHLGHPESSRHTPGVPDAERAYGHSHSAFLLGNAYIWPPRELLAHFEAQELLAHF